MVLVPRGLCERWASTWVHLVLRLGMSLSMLLCLVVMLTQATQILHGRWQRDPIRCRPQATRTIHASAATADSIKSEFGLEKGRLIIHKQRVDELHQCKLRTPVA